MDTPRFSPGSGLTKGVFAARDGPAFVGVFVPDIHSFFILGFMTTTAGRRVCTEVFW